MRLRHFRIVSQEPELPIMVCEDADGHILIQIGRSRPLHAVPIAREVYHEAMSAGTWPEGRSSKETT